MLNIYKQVQAKQDLINIWLYTFNEWGEIQADKYLDGLENSLHLLAKQPLICRERAEFDPPIRIHHYEHHIVVYLVIEDGINIIRVLHKNMDVGQQLEE